MKKEYNLLTKRLLSEGYSVEHYPDYVQIDSSRLPGNDPLNNLSGGFEYRPAYRHGLVFKTGCGLLVRGSHFSRGSLSYMGIDWRPENNNPVVNCPYKKSGCTLRNTLLGEARGGGLSKILFCDCHMTDEEYCYERSYEKVSDDAALERQRKYEDFAEQANGHVCQWHMRYDDWSGEWSQHYNPKVCAEHCMRVGSTCDMTGKPISRKRGNVFYDLKTTYIRQDGTLFDGQEVITIKKGVRLFETAKSITICESAAKKLKKEIERKEKDRFHRQILLENWKVEVLNIRAEQRESRDLMQDLQDIQNGITVIHASDERKRTASDKKDNRLRAKNAQIARLEKKIISVGYENLEEYSLDRRHADKWLGSERIEELEQIRQKRLEELENQPRQISLFELYQV